MEIKIIKENENDNQLIIDSKTLCELTSAKIKHRYTNIILATHCACCDELISIDDAVEYDDNVYCQDCCVECNDCGELIPRDYAYLDNNGNNICQQCFDENYFMCEYCNEVERIDDAIKVYYNAVDYELYCEHCANVHAYRCVDCGIYFNRDMITYTRDGNVCQGCLDYDYYYCEHCNEYVHYDDWDNEYDCCQDCAENISHSLVRDYHDNPPKFFYGCGDWYYGIELEIGGKVNYSDYIASELINDLNEMIDAENNQFYYMHDGSIKDGFEIITQPHTTSAFYSINWRTILDTIKKHGYKSHDNGDCGLHMHISRTLFGDDENTQNDNIAKLIYFYQKNWDDIVRMSRRTDNTLHWGKNWDDESDDASTFDGAKNIAKKKGWHNDRYHAINTTNDDTIEHRLMRGTLNHDTFMATIDFLLTISKNAVKLQWDEIDNIENWLDGINENTINYLVKRNAFINILLKKSAFSDFSKN